MSQRGRVARTGGLVRQRRLLSAFAALGLTAVMGFALPASIEPPSAHATEVEAFTGVKSNNNPAAQVHQYDTLSFTATWALPSDTTAGERFELLLPSELTGTTAAFDLTVEGTTETLGSCNVTPRALSCTVNDYVSSHQGVSGHVDFFASADQLTQARELTWRSKNGSRSWTTPLAAGIVPRQTQEPFPTGARKDVIQRFANNDPTKGQLWWFIHLGGEPLQALSGTRELRFDDAMDERLTVVSESLRLQYAVRADWGTGGTWHTLKPGERSEVGTVSLESTEHGVTAVLSDPVTDGTVSYRLDYRTAPPAGAADGDTFTNKVNLNGQPFASTTARYEAPDGEGTGAERGGSLSWGAVDGRRTALGGSAWLLTGPGDKSRTISDNGELDEDDRVGFLRISGLAWGDYSVRETLAPVGYELADAPLSATLSAQQLEVNLGTVEHAPSPGDVTWQKVDPSGKLLGGSAWELTGPGGQTAPVVDNGENDQDPTPGVLSIAGVAWGEYTLTETRAPFGYVLVKRALKVSVGPDGLKANFGQVVNRPFVPLVPVPHVTQPPGS